tara:strand:+ start:19026 stop:19289 length:264 start_codon:yes stop_codon:yes gene_type:complete
MTPPSKATFSVRVNGKLAEEIGTSRLSVEVTEPTTIQDILDEISSRYPGSSGTILEAIPFSSGNHRGANEEISPGQEITLLMPAAGG